jgi:hypothetical protein
MVKMKMIHMCCNNYEQAQNEDKQSKEWTLQRHEKHWTQDTERRQAKHKN